MAVTYEAAFPQAVWLAGEGIVVDLRLENAGPAPFETQDPNERTSTQPAFEITGPKNQKIEFRPNSKAARIDQGAAPKTFRIEPGGRWETRLSLSRFATLEIPGKYTLRTWIEQPAGVRIEAKPVEFQITAPESIDIAANVSLGPGSTVLVQAVELMEGGAVSTANLTERDPRNAELLPLKRDQIGSAGPDATRILGVYANHSAGLAEIQWIAAESKKRLLISHDATDQRKAVFDRAELTRILPLVSSKDALHAAAIRGQELVVTSIAGTENKGVLPGPVSAIQKLDRIPEASAMTISPHDVSPARLFIALAWDTQDATRLSLLTVDCQSHRVVSRLDHTVPGVRPLGAAAAAAWSLAGDLSVSLLVRNAAKASEIRLLEVHTKPGLQTHTAPVMSDPMILRSPLRDAQIAYFESMPGNMSRIALIRSSDSEMWVVPQNGAPRQPATPVNSYGPVALLPGKTYWYAVWADRRGLESGPL